MRRFPQARSAAPSAPPTRSTAAASPGTSSMAGLPADLIPSPLVGEGFPPCLRRSEAPASRRQARSCGEARKSHGAKGEGGFILDAASPLTPHRVRKCERVLPHKGVAGSLLHRSCKTSPAERVEALDEPGIGAGQLFVGDAVGGHELERRPER